MEKSKDQWEERTPQYGMGAIPKQPHPDPLVYVTDSHRQSPASASSTWPLAAQVDETDPVKKPNK